jgi:hypothetical protein
MSSSKRTSIKDMIDTQAHATVDDLYARRNALLVNHEEIKTSSLDSAAITQPDNPQTSSGVTNGVVPKTEPMPYAESAPKTESVPFAEPVPKTDPDPFSKLVPKTAPVTISEPASHTEPVPKTEPVSFSELMAELGPVPFSELMPKTTPTPISEPVSNAEPVSKTESVPIAEPIPKAVPAPFSGSVSKLEPIPFSEPVPHSASLDARNSKPLQNGVALPIAPYDSNYCVAVLKRLKERNRSLAALGMLFLLHSLIPQNQGRVKINQIVGMTGMSKHNILAQLQALENSGIIETLACDQNGRLIKFSHSA